MIRLCLVEDQALIREGIRKLLELGGDVEVVAQAQDGEEAIRVIQSSKPDVVLLDIRLPKLNGLEVLRRLKEAGALPPTVVLTTFADEDVIMAGIRAGAKGFLLKDVSLDRLTEAIRTVASGRTFIQPGITEQLLRGLENVPHDFPSFNPPDPLTERETEVLRLMAGGYSNREIADSLGVSEGTIKNHVSNILSKLGVRDRVRAVLKALDSGYV